MKPVLLFKTCLFILLVILFFNSCQKSAQFSETKFQEIISGFETPADSNTVWCYWYWINDDISKDGITKDLEAMKKAGIGAAFIGNINPAGKDGKVPVLSVDWWSHMVHAVTEGKRIGVDIGIFNCPGWSQSGGPWVSSEMAMRYLTFSETKVNGPGKIDIKLVQPKNEFQDTHTLAFLTPKAELRNVHQLNVDVNSSPVAPDLLKAFDGDTTTSVKFDLKGESQISIKMNLAKPISARQISLIPGDEPFKCMCFLYAHIDGKEHLIKEFEFDRSNYNVNTGPIFNGALAIALNNVSSSQFQLVCNNFSTQIQNAGFAEIKISEAPVLEKYIEKQLGKMFPTPLPNWDTYLWKKQADIDDAELITVAEKVLDISAFVENDGQLHWEAPEGEWTIMRIGMSPTGTKNSPSAPQGEGYEIDKMNSKLVKFHFDNFVGEFLKRIPEESKSAFKYVIADSYEMGSQNWTDNYEVRFKEKFVYNPVKYLPVLSGRIVGSVDESDRFLWDLRRSVADDVAYEYVGGLREASNGQNLQTWLENYGHWGFPSEFMMYGGQSNLIGGEFWNEGTLGNIECKASSSTSHTYGKGRTSAEAFTASGNAYLRHPTMLKKRGDWSFSEGINHFVLHVNIHQPDDNRIPGMNAWFSTEFNRHNTWFGQANNYIDYLRRCQHLLQQGQYAADVCYFIGENAPIMTGGRIPEIPKGFSYDYINAEVILNRLTVKDGKFILPDGMSYRVMVLPPVNSIRPELLEKLDQLVQQGGVVLGQKPEKSPSLQNYPDCDKQVGELAAKLWGGEYEGGKMKYSYGKGWVFDAFDLETVFEILKIRADVEIADAPVLWTHRTMPGMEIYFITNQTEEEINFEPSFRVSGLRPQLWDAITGEIRYLKDFTEENGRISVPLKMEAHRSWFIVFTNATNENIISAYSSNFPDFKTLVTIEGPFKVDFINKKIGPNEIQHFNTLEDWSKSKDEKIKFYSGTAKYKTTFKLDKLPDSGRLFMNLGKVDVMAEVRINGKEVGGVWISPYRLNIFNFVKEGENELEIEVVNLWRNHLIKDKMLPDNEKYTWTVVDDIKEGEELQSSGLLGPVKIETVN